MQTCMRAHLAICSITALLKSLLFILLVQQISKLKKKKKLSARHLEFKIKLLARKSEGVIVPLVSGAGVLDRLANKFGVLLLLSTRLGVTERLSSESFNFSSSRELMRVFNPS